MYLQELLRGIKYRGVKGSLDVDVLGITYDSKKVQEGFIFVAISGYKVDGHDFIPEAINRGARVVVAEKEVSVDGTLVLVDDSRKMLSILAGVFYNEPTRDLELVGVTGTNGKTTTAFLTRRILLEKHKGVGLIGTVENIVGGEHLGVERTTPEGSDLQALFARMWDMGDTAAVMEVSSHALALGRVAGCSFDVAVFTNLTQDHLDFHGDMEQYFLSKAMLFTSLDGCAVINTDDSYGQRLVGMTDAKVLTYGLSDKADLSAKDLRVTAEGTSFILRYRDEEYPVKLPLIGRFNVYNSLAAIGVGLHYGLSIEGMVKAIDDVVVPGRYEPIRVGKEQDFAVVVDYAHTPDGLENILQATKDFVKGRVITVFGAGGDRDRTKRPIMGRIAAEYSDMVIITSDNPRTEEPEKILLDIKEGVRDVEYSMVVDRREAINLAIGMAKSGDVILIAGKGHEDYQIFKDGTVHFDDREEATLALRRRFFGGEEHV